MKTMLLRSNSIKRCQSGVSLIELMVAVTIGAVLIFGATQVYVDSRNTYEVNESAARLQETARYALGVIEPDVRMSNYWGLVKGAGLITGQASQAVTSVGAPTDCGNNFARDLLLNLDGSNNAYRRNTALEFASGCSAFGAGAVASADTLTVRRAATVVGAPATGKLQICSTRIAGELVTDSTGCTAAPEGQINDLTVHTYYVSRDSTQRAGLPSLRRQTLISTAIGPEIRNDEIIPGVEDLQIQFGIDPTGTTGIATRYVNPGATPAGAQVVSVRIWLLIRSENIEVGFTDGRTYTYGDRTSATTTADLNAAGAAGLRYAPDDNFRRLLVSRTIQVRNALGT